MATETEASGGLNTSITGLAESTIEAYREMETPIYRYVGLIVVPSFVFFLLTLVVVVFVPLPLLVKVPIPLLGTLGIVVATIYPKILRDQKRKQIEDRLHLFITHMTILSTTNIDRVEVFRTLAREDEYKALADEAARIVQLVDTWNQSLDDACRIRAKKVPSKPLADVLDRLSYSISAGQELHEFLLSEQDAMIQKYVTVYEGSLSNLEVMHDLYLSMILSVTFALVFGTVLPILTGSDPTVTVGAVVIMFAFVQGGFIVAIRAMAPFDPLWYHPPQKVTRIERKIRISVAIGVGLSILLILVNLAVMMGMTPIDASAVPIPLYAAIPTTPLLIPGYVIRNEEQQVAERDDEFANFIRALGATETAKQSTTSKVLSTLQKKDFGALTPNVIDLYKRLNMRIESSLAWRHFTADCRSYLIQTFSEMYLIGREMGGQPKLLGELISKNMNVVLQLRERRTQSTTTLIGVLYGISAASTFAFFIGLQVVDILSNMGANLNNAQFDIGQIIHSQVYHIMTIEYLLVIIILANALLSALMIRIADGGHKLNSYMHFVLLTWISALIAIMTKYMVSMFIHVN